MRTNIQLAINIAKDQDRNKNKWADSLKRGDLIALNDRAVVYISHETKRLPNGMGGTSLSTHYTVIDGKNVILASDQLNYIEPFTNQGV